MFEARKFRVLEIIIQNRKAGFDAMRVALMSGLPEMSWEEIKSFVILLSTEGYVKIISGDNDIQYIAVQPTAIARLYSARETAKTENVKKIFDGILKLVSLV